MLEITVLDSQAKRAKLTDPHMTLENNPYYHPQTPEDRLIEYNECRLLEDARHRMHPQHGQAYNALMDTMRFKNKE